MTNRDIEKEILDNIAQNLCVVRLSLCNMDMCDKAKSAALLDEASQLIGKAVKDLRILVRKIKTTETTTR